MLGHLRLLHLRKWLLNLLILLLRRLWLYMLVFLYRDVYRLNIDCHFLHVLLYANLWLRLRELIDLSNLFLFLSNLFLFIGEVYFNRF